MSTLNYAWRKKTNGNLWTCACASFEHFKKIKSVSRQVHVDSQSVGSHTAVLSFRCVCATLAFASVPTARWQLSGWAGRDGDWKRGEPAASSAQRGRLMSYRRDSGLINDAELSARRPTLLRRGAGQKAGDDNRAEVLALLTGCLTVSAFQRGDPVVQNMQTKLESRWKERPTLTLVFSWDSQVCGVSVKVGSVLSKISTFHSHRNFEKSDNEGSKSGTP